MDENPAQPWQQLRTALRDCGADLTVFEDGDLDILWKNRYRSARVLQSATREGLTVAGLPPGLIDHILALQGAAAGPGPGSAEAADDIMSQRASESARFTGQVAHIMVDPQTGKKTEVPSCITAITTNCAATYAHNRDWKLGDIVQLEMYNTDTDSRRPVKAKVVAISQKHDYALLEPIGMELQAPVVGVDVKAGMKFFGHGLSCQGHTPNVYHGTIAGGTLDKYGHICGDICTGKGDSGGGVFSVSTGRLIGMMVGRDQGRQKSYIVPAITLVAAALELFGEVPDPDPPACDQMM